MAITPAHRVSKALHAAGIPTVSPESVSREGVKVRNLPVVGGAGGPTVRVHVDIDAERRSSRAVADVVKALTAAGYVTEIGEDGDQVYVSEPVLPA